MSGGPFDRGEFVTGYLAEAEEHLSAANAQLLKLEAALVSGDSQLRMIRELFRALHTVKGLSAMVGVEPIVAIAHELEALLRQHDQAARPLYAGAVELLFRGLRAIEVRVTAFAQKKEVEPAPAELLGALSAQLGHAELELSAPPAQLTLPPALDEKLAPADREQLAQGIAQGMTAYRLDFSPSPARAAAGLSITSVRERLSALCEIVKVVPQSVPKTDAAPSGLTFSLLVLARGKPELLWEAIDAEPSTLTPVARPSDAPQAPPAPIEDESSGGVLAHDTIRVEVRRLDDALDEVAALTVSKFRLDRTVRAMRDRGVDVRELETVLQDHRRELSRLRAAIIHARMVPVEALLERVPLLVRGMARATGKQVRLVVEAERAELDKAVAERLFPALVHLIRNAVDHAIEPAEERLRLGKPETGVITVRCFERAGNQLELSVSDDGAGIDRAKVAEKAGTPLPDDDRALLDLITRAGLSTRDSATERSGRGMGMDIVRRLAVDTLGGELRLATSSAGTTFTLRLPMSISILDSLTVRCGPQPFVVPLAMVDEIIEIDAARVVRAPRPRRGVHETKLLRRRDDDIPLFELGALFGLGEKNAGGLASALVVRRDDVRFAFSVDRVLGQQEVVIRPLEDPLVRVPGVSGTTDLGDGQPTLVLDLWSLSRAAIADRVGEVRA
ncbi:MAG: chemotaxis protein CheW [Polyangiales bacterium]